MALARTDIGVFADGSSPHGTAAFSTSSFTPPANSVLFVAVAFMGEDATGDLGVPTISGGGLTYTREATLDGTLTASWATKLVVFRAQVGGSPASMTITVDDDTNQVIYGWAVSVVAFTGHDTTTPTAGQVGTGSTNTGDGAHTVTLATAPTVDDVTLFWLGLDCDNNPANPTMAAGWTKVHDDGAPGGASTVVTARRENSTSTAVTVADVYTAAGSFFKGSMAALIVKAAAGESHSGTASVSGGGSVTASGRKGAAASMSVAGGGGATAAGAKGARGTGVVTGGGAVTATGSAGRRATFTVSGGGAVVVVGGGGPVASGSASVTGGGQVLVSGRKAASASVSVTGGGQVRVTPAGTPSPASYKALLGVGV